MQIKPSTTADIPEIFRLYRLATAYQKVQFPGNQWPEFERKLIEDEIAQQRQFKMLIEDKVACIWAIAYKDPELWKADDGISALYIHRIATNPDFRGNNYVKSIVEWARGFARDKKYIRMDTCGDNQRLIQHYKRCGFRFLGKQKLEDAGSLPAHYHNAEVCYFEIKLDQNSPDTVL